MKKALIAMSGGVDSSLAAKIMKDRGFDCIGCTMKLYNNEDAGIERSRTCCSLDDVEDARSVAYKLHMPFYVFNFTDALLRLLALNVEQNHVSELMRAELIHCGQNSIESSTIILTE